MATLAALSATPVDVDELLDALRIVQVVSPLRTRELLVEVQSGSYLGEDDIVRLDDDYGRAD